MAAAVLLLAGWLVYSARGRAPAAGESSGEELTYYNGAWYRRKTGVESLLVLGIDKAAVDGTVSGSGKYEQSDFLLLLVMDRKAGTCTSIHINRDTMVQIRELSDAGRVLGTFTGQITLAHAYGGQPSIQCRNAMDAVSNLLYGVKLDHYISLAMDGVAILNDMAGGVTLEVMDDFTGIDDTLVKGETVTLRGQQALTYVRARKGLEDASNIHRMARQRQYLEALQTQLLSRSDEEEDFALSTLMALNDYMNSDCSIEQLSRLSETLKETGVTEYRTLEGENVAGEEHYEFYVDEDSLRQLVMELFYEETDPA